MSMSESTVQIRAIGGAVEGRNIGSMSDNGRIELGRRFHLRSDDDWGVLFSDKTDRARCARGAISGNGAEATAEG